MVGKQQKYLSYLLRLWAVMVDGQPAWRASLENAQTGQQRGFASLAQLMAFLEAELAAAGTGEEVPLAASGEGDEEGD
jgi:hypothetical protein